jgi:hypothetical protein
MSQPANECRNCTRCKINPLCAASYNLGAWLGARIPMKYCACSMASLQVEDRLCSLAGPTCVQCRSSLSRATRLSSATTHRRRSDTTRRKTPLPGRKPANSRDPPLMSCDRATGTIGSGYRTVTVTNRLGPGGTATRKMMPTGPARPGPALLAVRAVLSGSAQSDPSRECRYG